ncbi:MAG: hypothetical protein AUH41_03175 [Gemmatimonadetes bacterium 13_1_40CM_66_11]|nr:MAG: hypothetical protein AUH41_03175 [Gemmatimonadetes bacterium 13_1_40CM_66_11]
MLLIREIMYCKPGKVRPMVEKFLAMAKLSAKVGMPKMRVMTDFCAERYWTLVAEMEVASMDDFERLMQGGGQNNEDMKEFENIMKDYHDFVEYGRREIYKIEGGPSNTRLVIILARRAQPVRQHTCHGVTVRD